VSFFSESGVIPLLALLGTVVTVAGTVISNLLLNRRRSQELEVSDLQMFRRELMAELAKANSRIESISKELDAWKVKYFDLKNQFVEFEREFVTMRTDMQSSAPAAAIVVVEEEKKS
jgi:predicted  nucleic acid-binding Zn-ribbon protein